MSVLFTTIFLTANTNNLGHQCCSINICGMDSADGGGEGRKGESSWCPECSEYFKSNEGGIEYEKGYVDKEFSGKRTRSKI